MELGRIGIWTNTLDFLPASAAAQAAAELEELGYAARRIPEAARREAVANAALLLGATRRMVVATGIANIYARGPMAMANAGRTLAEAHPGRFLPNYTNNLRRLGFGDDDLSGGGSDRLVDAIVGWGSLEKVITRVKADLDAGADHVCVQALEADYQAPPRRSWQELASALL